MRAVAWCLLRSAHSHALGEGSPPVRSAPQRVVLRPTNRKGPDQSAAEPKPHKGLGSAAERLRMIWRVVRGVRVRDAVPRAPALPRVGLAPVNPRC